MIGAVALALSSSAPRVQETPLMKSETYLVVEDVSRTIISICITDEAMRERIRQIMLDGLDNALKEQVEHVFSIWIKDSAGQPQRAGTGLRRAIGSYLQARTAAMNWNPPPCGPRP